MAVEYTDWIERADALKVRNPLLARATGISVHTIRAYRTRRFNPPAERLARIERVLTAMEAVVEMGAA